MDVRHLAHLVAVAETGNFRRAAERVHLSQPALSRSVQAAEASLGVTVFERRATQVRCTPAGTFVVERARRLLLQHEQLAREVRQFRDHEIGELSLGVGPFVGALLLPPLLAHLRKRHPGLRVRALVQNPSRLLEPLRRGELDLYVADARFVPDDGTFTLRRIGATQGRFYVRAGHPLLRRAKVRLADIAPYGFATGRLPAPVERELVRLMELPPGAPLPVAVECDDLLSLQAITAATDVVMVGTPLQVDGGGRGKRLAQLAPLDFPQGEAQWAIASLRERTLSPAAAYAADHLAQIAARHAA